MHLTCNMIGSGSLYIFYFHVQIVLFLVSALLSKWYENIDIWMCVTETKILSNDSLIENSFQYEA